MYTYAFIYRFTACVSICILVVRTEAVEGRHVNVDAAARRLERLGNTCGASIRYLRITTRLFIYETWTDSVCKCCLSQLGACYWLLQGQSTQYIQCKQPQGERTRWRDWWERKRVGDENANEEELYTTTTYSFSPDLVFPFLVDARHGVARRFCMQFGYARGLVLVARRPFTERE